MLDLQLQMRQNNEELKSFMQDLDTWESDIKTKDEALKSQKIEKDTVSLSHKCVNYFKRRHSYIRGCQLSMGFTDWRILALKFND